MTRRSNQRTWVVISIVLMACLSPSSAKVIYVDANAPGPTHDGSSWTNAYNYLQDALADAGSAAKPVEIQVAEGIYKPDQGVGITPGDQTATFQLINGVTIRGGYAGFGEPDPYARDIELYETILSGDLNGDDLPDFANMADNSIHVVNGSSTEPNAVLDGLTISDGYVSGMYNYGGSPAVANCTFSDNFANEGGGMYNTHFSDPVVTNCKFSLNQAGENGGAMCNEDSNPVVTGCTFVANSIMRFGFGFGGAVYNEGCSPTFDYCTFSENLSERGGGGMYNRDSSPTLTNCTFEGNWSGLYGGGLDTVMESSNPILIGCRFIGNSADVRGGGTSNGTSSLTLINCIFIDNSAADEGGAMNSCNGRNINVSNCTFYGNEAPNGNLLVCSCSQSNIQFTNCIMWDGGNEIWNPRGSIITLTYSDVYGGQMSVYDPCESLIWGEGNIDADPCFADANNGDYHLKSQAGRWDANSESWVLDNVTSPCIDAGNPGCPEANEPLLNGNRRNMGAYGGTAEASKSPPYWRSIADMTNDWVVDSNDLKVFVSYWLQSGECIPSDLDRDEDVDFADFALLSGSWPQVQNSDCLPDTLPEYPLWVALGKPLCWCYPRQCHGDADGQKTGLWWVGTTDLAFFSDCYFSPGPLPLPGCECADFNRDGQVDELDAAIIEAWLYVIDVPADCGGTLVTEPSMTYEIGDCIPVELGSFAEEETGETRFTVTVEGQYILFEDMMQANCCPEELELLMTADDDLITIYEIEHLIGVPCPCLCDFPITATLGPFQPGSYTLDVYEDGTFIGNTNITIAPGS